MFPREFLASTKGPPIPFCFVSTQEFLFLTETKGGDMGPALRWGGVNRGTLMTRFNIHLRFLWHPTIEVCVFYRPRHSCLGLLLKWMMPWCFQGFGKGPFFSLVAVVSPTPPDQSIYIIGRYTSQLPCYMQAVYRCLNEACPWYQPKKLPCNFSIPISIQNLPPWSLHCGGPWGKWFLQWSRRWIKWRFAPGWKIVSLSV